MSEITTTLETVSTLLGERARFDGWLRALEDKRASMPPHVVERVRTDYGERLLGVLTAIATHVGALDEAARSLASRDASLQREEAVRHDARAEAELRHAVGEYDDATWERLRDEHDGVLGTLAEERRGLATELATVRGLLAQAEDAQAVIDAGGPLAVAAAAPAPVADVVETPAEPAAEAVAVADAAADALAGTDAPVAVPPAAAVVPPPTVADDLDAMRAAIDRAVPAAEAAHPAAGHAAPLAAPSVPAAAAAEATGAPRGGDGRKTLKCGECGTMNLPTEWYCEQCGGELAVF